MHEKALRFEEVTFGFGVTEPLFRNLSCNLLNDSRAGKLIALMGPSGVGKTTFCDLALGIRRPQNGSVIFEPSNANIAFIPQKGVIFDELSIRENIACLKYSATVGDTFRDDKVQKAIDSLGLEGVLRSGVRACELSGGEAQRVMLARIQTVNCDILILDEPCSFLDNRVKESFLSALRATVNEYSLLAIMVTHVWEEARFIADEVVSFHKAPGQGVNLYELSVSETEIHPPTIDALFAIHWPDCRLIDVAEMPSLAPMNTERIPAETRFVGLFFHRTDGSEPAEEDVKLWNRYGDFLRSSSPRSASEFCVVSNFYDERGVRISIADQQM